MAIAASEEMIKMFTYLKSSQDNLFYGIIVIEEDDDITCDDVIEKDGPNNSKMSLPVPKHKKKHRIIVAKTGPEEHSPPTLVEFREEDNNIVTFYHGTRYIDAQTPEVILEDVDSNGVLRSGQFTKECDPKSRFCETVKLQSLEHQYIAIQPGEHPILLTVSANEILTNHHISAMITIFQGKSNNNEYDLALFFPVNEGKEKYYYYLCPKNSSTPESNIDIDRICITHKKDSEIFDYHDKHMFFRTTYHNPGGNQQIEEVDSQQTVHHVLSDKTSDLDDSTEPTSAPIMHKSPVHVNGEMVNGIIGEKMRVEELDDGKDSGIFQ